MKKDNKDNGPLAYLTKLKDLELHTDSGKINYRWGLLLIILMVVLTNTNWILKGLAFVVGLIKTFILNVNVVEEYEEANTFGLIIMTFVFFILCFVILLILEHYKENVKNKIRENNESEESR